MKLFFFPLIWKFKFPLKWCLLHCGMNYDVELFCEWKRSVKLQCKCEIHYCSYQLYSITHNLGMSTRPVRLLKQANYTTFFKKILVINVISFYCTIYAPQSLKINQKKKKKKKIKQSVFLFPSYFFKLYSMQMENKHTNFKHKLEAKHLPSSFRGVTHGSEGSERDSLEKATDTGLNSPALEPRASLVFGRANSNYSSHL